MADHLKAGPKKCPRDGHSKAGRSGFRMYTVFEKFYLAGMMVPVLQGSVLGYSIHPKAGYPAFKWFTFRTLFGSGYQMVKTRWWIPFESRTGYFSLAWTVL